MISMGFISSLWSWDQAQPWQMNEVVRTVFLAVATAVVVAVPVVYGFRANLRDPLARALLAGTGATAAAFSCTLAAVIAFHAGWDPSIRVWDVLTCATYVAVAIGKFTLLVALLRLLREKSASR